MIEQSIFKDQKDQKDQKIFFGSKVFSRRIIVCDYGKLVSVFCFGVFDSFPQDLPPQPLPENQSAMAESENQA
jgi:hypothetical protein